MAKPTGDGKFLVKVDTLSDVVRAWLYNFDVNGAGLKAEHQSLLRAVVGPVIRDGGNVQLLGLASTTGDASFDRQLGEQRVVSVVTFLRHNFGAKFTVGRLVSYGKLMALAFGSSPNPQLSAVGTGDNQEAQLWRAVVINAWNKPETPPPPADVSVPINDSTWADSLGKGLDRVSFALGIIDLLADLREIEAVTAVTGPAGLILGSFSSILQLPLIFATADALANTNGQIQGAADAIQDMADQFSDNAIGSKSISQWPAIRVPEIHIIGSTIPNASQDAWRGGQRTGLTNAVKQVIALEQNPKPVTLRSGRHIRMSGRLWLRALSRTFKDNAGVEVVIKPANAELAKGDHPPFPTR